MKVTVSASTTGHASRSICKSIEMWRAKLQIGDRGQTRNQKVRFCPSLTFWLWTILSTPIKPRIQSYLQNTWWRCKWACLTKQQWNVEAKRSSDWGSCQSGWKWERRCIPGKIWGLTASGKHQRGETLFCEALLFKQWCILNQIFVWLSDRICLAARQAGNQKYTQCPPPRQQQSSQGQAQQREQRWDFHGNWTTMWLCLKHFFPSAIEQQYHCVWKKIIVWNGLREDIIKKPPLETLL